MCLCFYSIDMVYSLVDFFFILNQICISVINLFLSWYVLHFLFCWICFGLTYHFAPSLHFADLSLWLNAMLYLMINFIKLELCLFTSFLLFCRIHDCIMYTFTYWWNKRSKTKFRRLFWYVEREKIYYGGKCGFLSFKIILFPKIHLFENPNCRTDVPKYLLTFLGLYYKLSYIRKLNESSKFPFTWISHY